MIPVMTERGALNMAERKRMGFPLFRGAAAAIIVTLTALLLPACAQTVSAVSTVSDDLTVLKSGDVTFSVDDRGRIPRNVPTNRYEVISDPKQNLCWQNDKFLIFRGALKVIFANGSVLDISAQAKNKGKSNSVLVIIDNEKTQFICSSVSELWLLRDPKFEFLQDPTNAPFGSLRRPSTAGKEKVFWAQDKASGALAIFVSSRTAPDEEIYQALRTEFRETLKCAILPSLFKILGSESCGTPGAQTAGSSTGTPDTPTAPKVKLTFFGPQANVLAFTSDNPNEKPLAQDSRFSSSPSNASGELEIADAPASKERYVYYRLAGEDKRVYKAVLPVGETRIDIATSQLIHGAPAAGAAAKPAYTLQLVGELPAQLSENVVLRNEKDQTEFKVGKALRALPGDESEKFDKARLDQGAAFVILDKANGYKYNFDREATPDQQNISFKIKALLSVPVSSLKIFAIEHGRDIGDFKTVSDRNCKLSMEIGKSGYYNLESKIIDGLYSYIPPQSHTNDIEFNTKISITPSPDQGNRCPFAKIEFEATPELLSASAADLKKAMEDAKKDNNMSFEKTIRDGKKYLAFFLREPKPDLLLVFGLNSETKRLSEPRLNQFFEQFIKTFMSIENKLKENSSERYFGISQVIASKDDSGKLGYEEIGRKSNDDGVSIFSSKNVLDKLSLAVTSIDISIDAKTNDNLSLNLRTKNPSNPSLVIIFGPNQKSLGSSCVETQTRLSNLEDQNTRFVVVAFADNEKILSEKDRLGKSKFNLLKQSDNANLYGCDIGDGRNVRHFVFPFGDAVAAADRGLSVQTEIFKQIAEWVVRK